MQFERCRGWRVRFRDLKNSHARFREFTFADAAKVEGLVARTATRMVIEDWHSFENGLRIGSGAVTLTVSEEQYRKLLC